MADDDKTLLGGGAGGAGDANNGGNGSASGKPDGSGNGDQGNGGKSGDQNGGGKGDQGNGGAGGAGDAVNPEALHDAAIKAVQDWQANPTPESKTAAEAAVAKAKEGFVAAKKAADDAAAKNKAPEKYEDFKVGDGKLIPEVADKFKVLAKAMNMSQENAQKIVDLQLEVMTKIDTAAAAEWKQQKEDWRKETETMLGAKKDELLGVAAKAIDRFGSPELKKLLEDTAAGNRKEFVQFFVNVGKAISEDKLADGKDGGGKLSDADVLYPKK